MPKLSINKDDPRLYKAGGIFVPSVTTALGILDDHRWMTRVLQARGQRELDRIGNDAAALGTRIHAVADRLAWDRDYQTEPELKPYARALREFLDQYVSQAIATELSLASEAERVGGTMDLVCEMKDKSIAVVDFKSRKNGGVTAKDRAQVAGYALLLREHGYKVNRRIVCRLHTSEEKRGRWYCRFAEDHAGDVRAFRAAVELYWWKHGKKLEGKKSA